MAAGPRMLQGFKVLDICQFVAGPTCTRLLAEIGRRCGQNRAGSGWRPPRAMTIIRDGMSTYYFQHNHSKRAIAMDLTKRPRPRTGQGDGAEIRRGGGNFTPGVMARMGLDYPALRAIHPALIMVSVSMAGQTGPLAENPVFDVIGQAYAGVTDLVGEPDRPPAVLPMAIGDISTGVAAAMAIAVAIIHRMRTGEGQHIDASLLDTYFHMHAMTCRWSRCVRCTIRSVKARNPRSIRRAFPRQWRLYRSDGDRPPMAEFTKAIGMPELENDPRFKEMRHPVQEQRRAARDGREMARTVSPASRPRSKCWARRISRARRFWN